MSRAETIDVGRWRLEFLWLGDRFAHTLARRAPAGLDDEPRPLWASVEGAPDLAWPPSPALQYLHRESRPGGVEVALLVGQAGKSHWSLSIALDPDPDSVTWEVACRVHDEPTWLGSSYRSTSSDPQRPLRSRWEWTWTAGVSEVLELSNTGFASPAALELVDAPEPRWCLRPAGTAGPVPRTICWGYRLLTVAPVSRS